MKKVSLLPYFLMKKKELSEIGDFDEKGKPIASPFDKKWPLSKTESIFMKDVDL